ncbi:MAG: hypothetical protein ACW99G_08005 [Candidatus Thorarchaeota archaeon]|jgi:hypothetical protein
MKLINLNGKEKEVESARIVLHDVTDAIGDGVVSEEYVEVVIVGKQSSWTEWWALAEFQDNNPDVVLEE